MRKEQAIESLRTHMSVRFETAEEDPWLMGVLVRCADAPLRAASIEQLLLPWEPRPGGLNAERSGRRQRVQLPVGRDALEVVGAALGAAVVPAASLGHQRGANGAATAGAYNDANARRPPPDPRS